MRSRTDPDIAKYCDLMKEIKLRIAVVDHFLSGRGNAMYEPPTLECVCLQVRKTLELVAFGSLIANAEAYASVYSKVSKNWHASELLKELELANPQFYPVPVLEVPSTQPGVVLEHRKRDGDYLSIDDFPEVYGRCGVLAHAANPYGKGIDYKYYAKMLPVWRSQIVNLLNNHELHLIHDPGMYVIHMCEDRDDEVHYYRFKPPQDS